MRKCIACLTAIWPWQKKGYNSSWHYTCMVANNKGYRAAMDFCNNENRIAGYELPGVLYANRMKKNNKVDWTNLFKNRFKEEGIDLDKSKKKKEEVNGENEQSNR